MKNASNNSKTFFMEDKPIFGLDIGHDMMRVIQLDMKGKIPRLKGYGSILFDSTAIVDGVIIKPEVIAKAAVKLFSKELVGDISTKRVAVSLPASKAYSHAVQLPTLKGKELDEAIQTESAQYLPMSLDNLYMDYTKLRDDADGAEYFVVAINRKIVDSYILLAKMLGLELILADTAIGASARLFALDRQSGVPSLLVDFGAISTDISVYNKGLVVTGMVAFGGNDVTTTLARALKMTPQEAIAIKSKFGLSVSDMQKQITAALEPSLQNLLKEIQRSIRYYEQRYAKQAPIGQVVTMGGGASMPGLADYLTEHLRLPVRSFDLAAHIEFDHLRHFYNADRMSYVTAAGLAITNPAEIFK